MPVNRIHTRVRIFPWDSKNQSGGSKNGPWKEGQYTHIRSDETHFAYHRVPVSDLRPDPPPTPQLAVSPTRLPLGRILSSQRMVGLPQGVKIDSRGHLVGDGAGG